MALFVNPRVEISRSASETDGRFFSGAFVVTYIDRFREVGDLVGQKIEPIVMQENVSIFHVRELRIENSVTSVSD